MSQPLDRQVGGSHYKGLKIQPLELVVANGLGFCEGNIVKYTTRFRDKSGVEDLRKVEHYIELHFQMVSKEPWWFRVTREWLSTAEHMPAISPGEYCDANGIDDKRQRYLISGVCFWRGIDSSRYTKTSMLNAVHELIQESTAG